tara:strand:+ start:367 stop:741 length:375 start_codon:yes stop_codon:yes gene_type:complete
MASEIINRHLEALTLGRIHILKILTMGGKEPSFDKIVWPQLTRLGYVQNITKRNFRSKLSTLGFGIKDGHVYAKGLSINKKRKRYPPKPALTLHKLTALEMAYNKASRLMNGFNRTLLPEEYEA